MSEPERSLNVEEFVAAFVRNFELLQPVTELTGLFDELAFDSLDALRTIIWTEAISGLDVPDIPIPAMFVIGDVYDYYAALRNRRDGVAAD